VFGFVVQKWNIDRGQARNIPRHHIAAPPVLDGAFYSIALSSWILVVVTEAAIALQPAISDR